MRSKYFIRCLIGMLITGVLLISGCTGQVPAQVDDPAVTPGPTTAPPPPSPIWDPSGLEIQPRMERLTAGAAAAGYEPGTTPWRAADMDWTSVLPSPPGDTPAWKNPSNLLWALAGQLPVANQLGSDVWELTVRLYRASPDTADGIIMAWGLQDDAIAGIDYLVTMRSADGQWQVDGVQQREHCQRRISPKGLCA